MTNKEMNKNVTVTDEERTLFYQFYEDRWDFSYDVLDRGLTLGSFIEEKRQDYSFMYFQPKPKHFSLIPDAIREEYKAYLKELLSEMWDEETANAYDEDDAIREFIDSYDGADEPR